MCVSMYCACRQKHFPGAVSRRYYFLTSYVRKVPVIPSAAREYTHAIRHVHYGAQVIATGILRSEVAGVSRVRRTTTLAFGQVERRPALCVATATQRCGAKLSLPYVFVALLDFLPSKLTAVQLGAIWKAEQEPTNGRQSKMYIVPCSDIRVCR